MLVAIVLITLLIGVALFSFRMQLLTVQKTKIEGINNVLKYNQIKSALESIKYYAVRERDMLGRPIKKIHYFFHGTKKQALFITNNPIYSDKVSLVQLTCKNNILAYKEEPLYGYMNYLQPSFNPHKFRQLDIYRGLQKCGFYYIDDKGVLVRQISNKIPKEIYLRISKNKKDISVYSIVKEDDNLTAARVYSAIYEK